jgi:hypothetical protein
MIACGEKMIEMGVEEIAEIGKAPENATIHESFLFFCFDVPFLPFTTRR